MDSARAEALVAELGQQLGIEALALDKRGTCTLAIDEGALIVTLGHNARTGSIDLMVCLDEVEPSGLQLVRILGANFGWLETAGATFALEPGSGALVLQRRCLGQELEHGGLRRAVEALVATADGWSRRLAVMAGAAEDGEAEATIDPGRLGSGVLRA
jgi:hypothetical protein